MSAVLVECVTKGRKELIGELKELAESRGYVVKELVVQRRSKCDPAFVIGRGKLQRLKDLIAKLGVNNVIFANTLKAGQAFRIRKELGWQVNVIDRNLVILEIFEQRAMTTEAKLQIELARLKYTLPWTREFVRYRNLYGEQVGFGAMGEYLHKTYEANARKRIRLLEEKLRRIRRRGEELLKKRREIGLPVVSLTGYTQAGKTTFFNAITNESKPVGLGPFSTLSTCARRVDFAGRSFIVVDSIGFIEELHPLILNAFYTTLSELIMSDVILLFVDASEPLNEVSRKALTANKVLRELAAGPSMIVCLNKIDKIDEVKLNEVITMLHKIFPSYPLIPISAKTGTHVSKLLFEVVKFISA
ncbi:MAG: GTPase HflX [Candidatus Nezhaarchaeales archaeon]